MAAAPLLALVARQKIARDVRKRALESAPHAVTQAETAVMEKFNELIDDFGVKLAEFVATAGEELHRGILEVLQKVRIERHEVGYAREEAEAKLQAQRERLSEIESKLEHMREAIWNREESVVSEQPD